VEQARANQIPNTAWPSVASALGGSYLQFGNPVYDTSGNVANWSTAKLKQQVALIDQLLAVTANPVAIQALQKTRNDLYSKLTQ